MSLDIHISSQNIICLIYCKALSPKNNHFKELYFWNRRCRYKEIVLNTGHHFFVKQEEYGLQVWQLELNIYSYATVPPVLASVKGSQVVQKQELKKFVFKDYCFNFLYRYNMKH